MLFCIILVQTTTKIAYAFYNEPTPATIASIPVTQLAEVETIREYSLEESIEVFSKEYNVPKQWLLNLAKCESTMGSNWVGDGGRARGPYQYHPPTWLYFEEKSGMDLNRESTHDQSKMTAWALKQGLSGHWSCSHLTGKVK